MIKPTTGAASPKRLRNGSQLYYGLEHVMVAGCARGGGSFGSSRVIATYEDVRDELFDCLQSMWDEGITPGQKGHWETMRNPNFEVAHCGFAFTASGRLMATQDLLERQLRELLVLRQAGGGR